MTDHALSGERMDEPNLEKLYKEMRTQDSDRMEFHLSRKAEVGHTFSLEGLQDLERAIDTFIGARIMAHWDAKGDTKATIGPSELAVQLTVTVDGKHFSIPADQPWYASVDGEHRQSGVKDGVADGPTEMERYQRESR